MTKNFFLEFLHFFGFLFLALIVVLGIRFFVVQPFLVRGESMAPTFHNFDYLFVERVSYYLRDPKRGDVVVFRFPQNESDFFIKRIIGLPGEKVTVENGSVKIREQGKGGSSLLEEPSPFHDTNIEGGTAITLGESDYFVLGDNRGASFDSRKWGVLPRRNIIGRVFVRIWPPMRAKAFFADDYHYNLVMP